jgi:hypothetical protein
MQNNHIHKYIIYFLKKIDKKYNRKIILFYDKKCKRANITVNSENISILTYGDGLINRAKSLGKKWRYEIRYTILHEMGHILHPVPYETFKDKVNAEYVAERFCLNYLKEHFPATYKWCCKEGYALVHNPKWATCKSELHYKRAWEQIEEYFS